MMARHTRSSSTTSAFMPALHRDPSPPPARRQGRPHRKVGCRRGFCRGGRERRRRLGASARRRTPGRCERGGQHHQRVRTVELVAQRPLADPEQVGRPRPMSAGGRQRTSIVCRSSSSRRLSGRFRGPGAAGDAAAVTDGSAASAACNSGVSPNMRRRRAARRATAAPRARRRWRPRARCPATARRRSPRTRVRRTAGGFTPSSRGEPGRRSARPGCGMSWTRSRRAASGSVRR